MTDGLTGWTIYRKPRDFPQHIVVRAWRIRRDGGRSQLEPAPIACLCHTLAEARTTIPAGAVNLHRWFDDDPVIIETWI